jgi:hypothetical protein
VHPNDRNRRNIALRERSGEGQKAISDDGSLRAMLNGVTSWHSGHPLSSMGPVAAPILALADPDPEPEAPAAQHVQRGGRLGDEHGLALRQDQHLG